MPRRAMDDGKGVLTIRNIHKADEGTYMCTGSNFWAIDSDEGQLVVQSKEIYFIDRSRVTVTKSLQKESDGQMTDHIM